MVYKIKHEYRDISILERYKDSEWLTIIFLTRHVHDDSTSDLVYGIIGQSQPLFRQWPVAWTNFGLSPKPFCSILLRVVSQEWLIKLIYNNDR